MQFQSVPTYYGRSREPPGIATGIDRGMTDFPDLGVVCQKFVDSFPFEEEVTEWRNHVLDDDNERTRV